MSKKILQGVLCVFLFLAFLRACGAGIFHEHDWQAATCTEPRICSLCKAEEGEPLGHDWQAATCSAPQSCIRCGEREGTALDHTWVEATCTEPEHCSDCGKKRHWYSGTSSHDWQRTTCTGPEICIVCGQENPITPAPKHDWIYPSLTSPWTCAKCGATEGEPLSISSFNRGHYGQNLSPSPADYIGLSGYVAVTHLSFMYPTSTTSPHENDWLSGSWYATTYARDKQFYQPIGTVAHKTAVVVIDQDLTADRHSYDGFLLVEQIDTGEQFYISVVDFVAEPYWEDVDINNLYYSHPYLAVYSQHSDYWPVDRNGRKANLADGEVVFISGYTSWGGIDPETHLIDASTKNGRYFFNSSDLTIVP